MLLESSDAKVAPPKRRAACSRTGAGCYCVRGSTTRVARCSRAQGSRALVRAQPGDSEGGGEAGRQKEDIEGRAKLAHLPHGTAARSRSNACMFIAFCARRKWIVETSLNSHFVRLNVSYVILNSY